MEAVIRAKILEPGLSVFDGSSGERGHSSSAGDIEGGRFKEKEQQMTAQGAALYSLPLVHVYVQRSFL